ncbi:CTP synthase C-terminal region-related (seleno)protein [Actinocorallia longicatena]|uniref:CTP synthase (glutamine hydrolyzing) n=1 Tax=Actinocorallia longicatena TaxID=111803 RepID=A0ABP6Q921_9ACTN
MLTHTARIALVGNRSENIRAHARVPRMIQALADRDQLVLDAYWIPTEEAHQGLEAFDGIWLLPGSPYRSETGAVAAVRTARENAIPFLGTCGGFQHAVLEFARNVCGLAGARNAESEPGATEDLVIVPLTCSLEGHETEVRIAPGSTAEALLGAERSIERFFCSYGLNNAYLPLLEAAGLRFSGRDTDGEVRVAELPGHPFFLGTLFQPELAGDGTRAHPILRGFASAAVAHSSMVTS